jgi:hypothetical protein
VDKRRNNNALQEKRSTVAKHHADKCQTEIKDQIKRVGRPKTAEECAAATECVELASKR